MARSLNFKGTTLVVSGSPVPWIDDDPEAWSYVVITPSGGASFRFPCHYKGKHDTKIDQRQALDRPGHKTTLRGRKGCEIDFILLLMENDDLQNYRLMMPDLMLSSSRKVPVRCRVEHPALLAAGIRNQLFYKAGTLPERNTPHDVLSVTLGFIEDLPPGPTATPPTKSSLEGRSTILDRQPGETLEQFTARRMGATASEILAGQSLPNNLSQIPPDQDPATTQP